MRIIGLTGTIGAGKGTVVEYLLTQWFTHYSVRAKLSEILNQRQLESTRENMVNLGNELREQHGPAYLAELCYAEAEKMGHNAVIESIRTPGEVAALAQNEHFELRAVDAPIDIRYQRIVQRNSATDHVTFEEFVAGEQKEMHNDDPNKQNIAACIEAATHCIINDGTTDELEEKVQEILSSS